MTARIEITYETEENGASITKELPFTVGIIGDFIGNASPYTKRPVQDRDFIPVTQDNIESVFIKLKPTLSLSFDNNQNSAHPSQITLAFKSIDDFKPDNIIQNTPQLKQLWDIRQQLRDLQSQHNYAPELIETLRQQLNNLITKEQHSE